jgi:hypothetical protein
MDHLQNHSLVKIVLVVRGKRISGLVRLANIAMGPLTLEGLHRGWARDANLLLFSWYNRMQIGTRGVWK